MSRNVLPGTATAAATSTSTPTANATATDQLRLMAIAARLYHVHGTRQREIGERLGMSQAKVSRLLQQAEATGLVETVVRVPDGIHAELEDTIEAAYGVQEVHVVDVPDALIDLAAPLGRAAAHLLSETVFGGAVVGFTSWSRTFQEMAQALDTLPRSGTQQVVEMLGDLGSPALQHNAARATQTFARALGAEPVYLRTPGVVATPALRDQALRDPYVRRALDLLDDVDVALVGLGPVDVHSNLAAGDSYFQPEQFEAAQSAGAAGQLNQRLLDAAGQPLRTPLDDLVIGSTLEQIRRAHRRVVVAGGPQKYAAMQAALTGGWVDLLVTDVFTARRLTP